MLVPRRLEGYLHGAGPDTGAGTAVTVAQTGKDVVTSDSRSGPDGSRTADRPVLYLLNVSNPDRLSSDSGWLFADILLPALVDLGHEVVLAAPRPVTDPRVGFLQLDRPPTKYHARFSPDPAQLTDLIQRVRPGVVVANQIETVPAIRAALMAAGVSAGIAGYCHYLPFSVPAEGEAGQDAVLVDVSLDDERLGWPVILAFFSGLLACDAIMVHSAFARDRLVAALQHLSLDLGRVAPISIVSPPCDPRIVQDEPIDPVPWRNGVPARTGLYNHRLYAHYGTGRFVHLVDQLQRVSQVRITVADVLGQRSAGRTSLDRTPEQFRNRLAGMGNVDIRSDGGDRLRYRDMLASADFGIAPFREGCTWSMSVIDCQAMGTPVISPRMAWQTEAAGDELSFSSTAEAIELIQRLTTDAGFWIKNSVASQASTARLASHVIARQYAAVLSSVR